MIDLMQIWSCNPKDIKPWTEEEEERFNKILREIFNNQEELGEKEQQILSDNIQSLYLE